MVMEKAMRLSVTMIGVLMLAGAPAMAEPVKPPAEKPVPAPTHAPQLMFASADAVRAPLATGAAPQPTAKRRVAPRVTTCRCGDALPAEAAEQQ
jgi:hypothetical protein